MAQCFSPASLLCLQMQSPTEVREGWMPRCHTPHSVPGMLTEMNTGSQRDQIWLKRLQAGGYVSAKLETENLLPGPLRTWG